MLITKKHASEILEKHGMTLTSLTAWDSIAGIYKEGTSFLDEMGDHEEYDDQKVREWLGY